MNKEVIKEEVQKCLSQHCTRSIYKSIFCAFHTPMGHKNRISDKRFFALLSRLIKNNDGKWNGFVFPKRIEVGQQDIPIEINAKNCSFGYIKLSGLTFREPVDISGSQINDHVECQSSKFLKSLNISNVSFNKTCFLNTIVIEKDLHADHCHFRSDFSISGTIGFHANFNSSTFYSQARFRAVKNISVCISLSAGAITMSGQGCVISASSDNESRIDKAIRWVKYFYSNIKNRIFIFFKRKKSQLKNWVNKTIKNTINFYNRMRVRFPHKNDDTVRHVLFNGEASFEDVSFLDARKVLFQGIDLRKTSFGGTDLRKVEFVGNNWFQSKLKRNGLKEDVYQRTIENYYDKREMLPKIENSYRNIRYSLESNKNFSQANDFFVGEMDAQRKQYSFVRRYVFSLSAWYNYISKYGTSPLRCFLWFLFAAAMHSLIISGHLNAEAQISAQQLGASWGHFLQKNGLIEIRNLFSMTGALLEKLAHIYVYSLQTMTLQKEKIDILIELKKEDTFIPFINTVYSILGPVLAGLFALTIRTKIKRH